MPDTSDTSGTREIRMRHERDTSDTSVTQVQHECYTKDTSATRVLHGRHECHTSEKILISITKNIFLHSYIYYMASERLQGEEQFHFKYYLLKCLISTAKTELCNGKSYIKKLYTKLYLVIPLHNPA